MEKRAVFLDRDGTLNVDYGYVHRLEDWRWQPKALSGLQLLASAKLPLVVISNQSGLARGYFQKKDLQSLEAHVTAELAKHKVEICAWYYCPHLPEISGPCTCRKPAPGLFYQAAREHGFCLRNSWMVGDSLRDVSAALACGCLAIKLGRGETVSDQQAVQLGAQLAPDLFCAAKLILDGGTR